jgi:glycosyltransferase involved in cell wall biosynthesis
MKPITLSSSSDSNRSVVFSEIDRAGSGLPLSVALVSPGWPSGAFANGVIPCVEMISLAMRAQGHRATVLTANVVGEVDELMVRHLRPHHASSNPITRTIDRLTYQVSLELGTRRQYIRALVEECRRLIDDRGLQLLEMEEAFGLARWVGRRLPIPVAVRLHGPWFLNGPLQGAVDDAAFRRRVRLEKEAILAADAITAPSLDVLERTRRYYGLGLEQAKVITNPTAMVPAEDRWRAEASEPETILFVGRFDRHKGGDLVIDAFAQVARRRPQARLLFIGPDRDYRDDAGRPWTIQDYMRDRLSDEGIAGRARWLGAQPGDSLPEFRRKAAVVVVGSRYDNFPGTVLEAMALGTPLVAPRIGGIPEIVFDGVNGLLYEAGNASDMAAKLLLALEDRDLAVKLGAQAGIDCERRHHPSTLAGETARFFGEVIEAKERSGRGVPSR